MGASGCVWEGELAGLADMASGAEWDHEGFRTFWLNYWVKSMASNRWRGLGRGRFGGYVMGENRVSL